jgi:hypothetical protein
MALAAVKTGAPAASLAERVAEAQRAEVRPRNRVAELQGRFDEALAAKRYAEADQLQAELQEAREALVMAEALTRGLREGQALAEAQKAEEQRAIRQAHAEDEARRVVEDAMASERRALDSIEECLAQMWAAVGAARDAFRQAQGWEGKAFQERARAHQAMVTLGERPDGLRINAPNRASVLLEQDATVRALMQWAR